MTLRPRRRKPAERGTEIQRAERRLKPKRQRGPAEEGLREQVEMTEKVEVSSPHPCSDCISLWTAARFLALGTGQSTSPAGPSPPSVCQTHPLTRPQPSQPSGVPPSPALQRRTACCHCSLGSSGQRPAVAGTAGPPGEPARQGELGCYPSNCGQQVSVDPGFRGSTGEKVRVRSKVLWMGSTWA